MEHCSNYEQNLLKAKMKNSFFMAEYYPEIVRFHQNELLSFFDAANTEYLVGRKRKMKEITGRDQLLEHIRQVKLSFRECLGELPGCAGLKASAVGTLDRGSYRIDRVLIESMPGYHLTANFYYPAGLEGKAPGILLLSGHASNGKAYPMQVHFCMEAVDNGFCVLTFDPVGHGERMMYFPEDAAIFKSRNPDHVHYLVGQQACLAGDNLTRYMMLDNVRALDYLCTRPEVDASKLAVTGCSGGGQMSAFLGAFDERLAAVAPCCYISELRAMIYNIGAQEPEQSMPRFMEKGLDQADLILAAAPRPYFIGSALMDYFPIDGTRDTFIEARRMYRLLEAEDNLEIYTAPKPHGFWCDTRSRILRFFCRHFAVPYVEDKRINYVETPEEAELYCVSGGNVNSCNRRSLQQILQSKAMEKYPPRPSINSGEDLYRHAGEIRKRTLELLAFPQEQPASQPVLDDERHGGSGTPGMHVSDISLWSEPRMKIYGRLYTWDRQESSRVLIHVGALEDEAVLDRYGREYAAVFCIEPRGTGRGRVDPGCWFYTGDALQNEEASYNCNAAMLGRSVLGMRVLDVVRGTSALQERLGTGKEQLEISGRGENAITALFAAAVTQPGKVRLEDLLYSYREIINHRVYGWGPSTFAWGLVERLDIEDLLLALAPAKVEINGLRDAMNNRVDPAQAKKLFQWILEKYGFAGNEAGLKLDDGA